MSKKELEPLSKSEFRLLSFLRERAKGEYVHRVDLKQSELADKLRISRQALSVKLRPLIDRGYIRTGRGFVELTEKSMTAMGLFGKPAYILVKIEPDKRERVYRELTEAKLGRVNRVAGDVDLVLEVDGSKASKVLDVVSSMKGILQTKTYFTLELLG